MTLLKTEVEEEKIGQTTSVFDLKSKTEVKTS